MKLRSSIVIAAAPVDVWPWIADPALQSGWNPRIVEVARNASGPVREGERYAVTFKVGKKPNEQQVRVAECEPPARLRLEHDYGNDRVIQEIYEIEPCDGGSRLRQTIDISESGMAQPFRLIFWLMHHLGTPQSRPFLDRLRELVEQARGHKLEG